MRFVALACAAILGTSAWATSLVYDAYVPTTATTVFEGVQLSEIGTKYFLAATMDGGYIDNPGPAAVCNRDTFTNSSSEDVVRYELQTKDGSYIKCVIVELTQDGDNIKAVATNARYIAASNGIGYRFQESGENGTYNGEASIAPATSDSTNGYGVSGLKLVHSELLYYISCDNCGDGGVALATDGGIGTVVPTAWKSGYRNYDGTEVKFGTKSAKLNSGTLGLADNTSGLGVGTSEGFTVSFWANIGSDIQDWASFIALRIGSENYRLEHMSNDSFAMYRGTGDAPFAGLAYTAGEWAHYALVFGTDGSLTVYQNGTSVKTASGFSGVLKQAAMGPGRAGSAADASLRGQSIGTTYIDDFAIFKGALTAEEIATIANANTPIAGFTGNVNPSININFASGTTVISTSGKVGASDYAVPGTYWSTMTSVGGSTFNSPLSTVSKVSTAGYKVVSAGTSVKVEDTRGSWYCGGKATKSLLHGYIDDRNNGTDTPIATITGIPSEFDYYRVVLYFSNDTDGRQFGYVSLNDVEYWGTEKWGSANNATLTENGNYLVSPILPRGEEGTLKITTRAMPGARAGLAAVQIIKAEPAFKTIEVADGGTSTVDLAALLETYDYVKFVCSGSFTLAFTSEAELTQVLVEKLDFTEVTGDISLGANVVYDISATRTLPAEFKFTTGSTVVIKETSAEYGNDRFAVSNLEGVSYVKLNRVDGTTSTLEVENGSASRGTGEVKIGGAATMFDITFANNRDDVGKSGYGQNPGTFTYKAKEGARLYFDHAATFNNDAWDETTGLYLRCSPYINDANDVFSSLDNFTAVVVGQMSPTAKTIFVHMGGSYHSTSTGLMIATTEKADEVLIAKNTGGTVDDAHGVKVSVPNAATARHAYVIVKSGTEFTVWVDGIKRGNFDAGEGFTLGSTAQAGLQVGADFGNGVRSAGIWKGVADNESETGVVNVIRVFDYAISDAQAAAIVDAYPYVPQGGLYTRTVSGEVELEATDAWDRDGDTENKYDLPESVVEGYNTSVTITVDGAAALAVNATLNVETLTIGGNAALTVEKEEDNFVKPTSAAVINTPVTTEYGALDLTGVPVQLSADGSLTFDCSGLAVTEGEYQLTGLIDQADNKVTVVPPTNVNYFYTKNYKNGYYELVATLAEATYDNTPYATLAAAIEAASEGDTITLNKNVESITLDKNLTINAASGVTSVGTVTMTTGMISLAAGTTYTLGTDTWAATAGNVVSIGYAASHTVTVAATEHGSVAISASDIKGTASPYTVKHGVEVTITITPDEDYEIDGDSDDLSVVMGDADITEEIEPEEPEEDETVAVATIPAVTGDLSITIPFKLAFKTFTVEVPDNTTISVQGGDAEVVDADTNTYKARIGENVTITYTADGDYVINGASQKVISLTADTDTVTRPEGMEVKEAVARVDYTLYDSLAGAVAVATAYNAEVVVLKDITLTERVEPSPGMSPVTINLNGHKITRTGTSGNGSVFDVKSGTVTIKNGTIDCTQDDTAIVATGVYAITARTGSNVTLEDLTVTVNSQAGACVYPFTGAAVTINSGTYRNNTAVEYQYKTGWTGMAVNQANVAQQLITITGGSFWQVNPEEGDDSGLCTNFLATGRIAKLQEGYWVVQAGTWVAEVGGVKYETFSEALEAAEAGQTVKLLQAVPDALVLDKAVTIDVGETVSFGQGIDITVDGGYVIGDEMSFFLGDTTWIVETISGVTPNRRVKYGYGERRTVKMDYLSGDGNVVVTIGDLVRQVPEAVAAEMGGPSGAYFYVKDGADLSFTVTPYGDRLVSSATIKVGAADPVDLPAPVGNVYTAAVTGDSVVNVTFAMAQAKIGTTLYPTLAEALAAATDGQTVTLVSNVALTERLFVNAGAEPAFAGSGRYATTTENKAITLDLNNCNITTTHGIALAGGSLTVTGTGKITCTDVAWAPIEIRGTGDLTSKRTLTIGQNVTLEGTCYGLNVFGSNNATKNKIDVTVNGTVKGMLFVLGNLRNQENEINIVVNGTVDASEATGGENVHSGIAVQGHANVTVGSTAIVKGESGIEIRDGSLSVAMNASITGTVATYSYNPTGNGATIKGAAIAVAQYDANRTIDVRIETGASLSATKAVAVVDDNNDMSKVSITVAVSATWTSEIPNGYKWVEAEEVGYYTLASAGIDPTDSTSTQEVAVDPAGKTQAQIEEAAIAAASVKIPEAVVAAATGVTAETYKTYFNYTVTQSATYGKYEVKVDPVNDLNEEVVFPASESDELTEGLADALDADATEVTITTAKPGLYYSIEAATNLGFTEGKTEGTRKLATSASVDPVKPAVNGTPTAVFYRVKVSATPNN